MMTGTFFPVGNLMAVWMCLLVSRNVSPQVLPAPCLSLWVSIPFGSCTHMLPSELLRAILLQHCFAKELLLNWLMQRSMDLPGLVFWVIAQWHTAFFLSFTGLSLKTGSRPTDFLVNFQYSMVIKSLHLEVRQQWIWILALQAAWIINLCRLVVLKIKWENGWRKWEH